MDALHKCKFPLLSRPAFTGAKNAARLHCDCAKGAKGKQIRRLPQRGTHQETRAKILVYAAEEACATGIDA